MEIIYFTLAGALLYLISDAILEQIELKRGKRFTHRSFIFFMIISILAISVFTLLEKIL